MFDFGNGSMAFYPWKYQLLLTSNDNLVELGSGQRFDFVTIFPNQNPFLMTVTATTKGNGGHEIYKISENRLENVYESDIKTYDAHEDNKIYEPYELVLKIKDFNNDGYNDISFMGKLFLFKDKQKMATGLTAKQ
ncbi:MAG: hypothetical protein PHC38_03875 [Weeksellaceae bacterium]|nr:hypothetical protein [Weeksellaceae bacterium]